MANSPRKVGDYGAPYLAELTDDKGNLVNISSLNAGAFTLLITNVVTRQPITPGGSWSLITDPEDGILKASYAYAPSDVAAPGVYDVWVKVQFTSGPRFFGADRLVIVE
jgi:hypothetical protein